MHPVVARGTDLLVLEIGPRATRTVAFQPNIGEWLTTLSIRILFVSVL
jgi:hypothetical protein